MTFLKLFLRGIALLPGIIQGVESLFGANTGAQKKDAALSIVTSSINMVDAVAGKQVINAAQFEEGLGKMVDGIVECLNASVWAKTTTTS